MALQTKKRLSWAHLTTHPTVPKRAPPQACDRNCDPGLRGPGAVWLAATGSDRSRICSIAQRYSAAGHKDIESIAYQTASTIFDVLHSRAD